MTPDAENSINLMFRAFSDPTRLRIMNLLTRGELCVCDIVYTLGVPESSVSRNLTYLNKAGLVSSRRDGEWLHYRLVKASRPFHKRLINCLRCFPEVPLLTKDVERLNRTNCGAGDIQNPKK